MTQRKTTGLLLTTSDENRRFRGAWAVVLVSFLLAAAYWSSGAFDKGARSPSTFANEPKPPTSQDVPPLSPFLEIFNAAHQVAVKTSRVEWIGVSGKRHGHLARPDDGLRLPALIIVADEQGLSNWLKLATGELAGVGYVVLAVEIDEEILRAASRAASGADLIAGERVLADLSAAVRWLRRRKDVLPKQIGSLGWSMGSEWALKLAASEGLEACVLCDGAVSPDPALLAGLRHTAVLEIQSGAAARLFGAEKPAAFRKALDTAGITHHIIGFKDAAPGFMNPNVKSSYRFDDAERAWLEIYEFLGKYVEDAAIKALLAGKSGANKLPTQRVATLADLMQAVNSPAGVRGQLSLSLAQPPKADAEWKQVRARAALLAEAGNLLLSYDPPGGGLKSWRQQATAYRRAATSLAAAADRQDYAAARGALNRLATSCGDCHKKHR